MSGSLRIATRGSALALRQTEIVVALLKAVQPVLDVQIQVITTTGDRDQQAPIASLGDGVFVRGIERELLGGRADAAVHSAKDMPSTEPLGLAVAAYPRRGDSADMCITRDGRDLADLPAGARVGTGSPRRAALVRALRPDLDVALIRGNVDTRLRRLEAGEHDAVILAAAGIERLGRDGIPMERLEPPRWLPAPGQGALAVQCRAGDAAVAALLRAIDDHATRAAVEAERAVLRRLGSGCRVPVAALGEVAGSGLRLRGALLSPDGAQRVDASVEGSPEDADALGTAVAEALLRSAAFAVEGIIDGAS